MRAISKLGNSKVGLEKRVRFSIGVPLSALFLALAGCGGSEDVNSTKTDTTPSHSSNGAVSNVSIDGEMYSVVNGERRKWYVTHLERGDDWQSGSFWRSTGIKNTTQVTIFGLPTKAARQTGKGDIMISLMISESMGAARVVNAEITYFADGFSKTWTVQEGSDATVVLNRFLFDGDYLDLGGSFSGVVELPDLGNAATETEMPRRIEIKDGAFAVRIRQFQK